MKAAYITGYGGNEVVAYGDLATPTIKPGDVLVDVHAAGVNPVEVAMRNGEFKSALKFRFPQVMGYDISGVVSAVAPGVAGWKVGDAVFARLPNRALGAYAEQVGVPKALLARKPANLTHIEAASLPTVALTAWQGLHERAALKNGETLLVHAGAGGVGTVAVQLARSLGARVIATASRSNHDFLRELGAAEIVDYTSHRFETLAPFDVVLDGVGNDMIERSIRSLRPSGRYVGLVRVADPQAYREIGVPGPIAWLAARPSAGARKLAKSRGVAFHGILTRPDGALLQHISRLAEERVIRPVVSATFGLAGLAEAYDKLAAGHVRGKLVIDIRQ